MHNEPAFKSYIEAAQQIDFVITSSCFNSSQNTFLKKMVQDSYRSFGIFHQSSLNLGLWDKTIHKEYQELYFDFSKISSSVDIYSQLMLYFMIRSLYHSQFFNKRLLEVGCGNGLGLVAHSKLLKTNYALGVDLTNELATSCHHHYYQQEQVNFIQTDAECLPLENESFDIITNLESSHIYPQIELFFSEVERVLSVGGVFCYSDAYFKTKDQANRLERFMKQSGRFKIIQKTNITKMVQASTYQRLIVNEEAFFQYAKSIIEKDRGDPIHSLLVIAMACGLYFLPWWKIRFKNPERKYIAQFARKVSFLGKKYYFYYLIQKIK